MANSVDPDQTSPANSVDPDQTVISVDSDQTAPLGARSSLIWVYTVCLGLYVLKLRIITVCLKNVWREKNFHEGFNVHVSTGIRPVLVKNIIILASYVNKWIFI